jgi:hypothetical protein
MKKYELEIAADNILKYLADFGSRRAVTIQQISDELNLQNAQIILDVLIARGFVENLSHRFSGAEPVTFCDVYCITPAGVYFATSNSFVSESKDRNRKRKFTRFEVFKMGWDTIIAIVSLIISILALITAAK